MQEINFESDKKDVMNDKKKNKLIFILVGIAGLIIIIFFLLFKFFTPFGAIVSYQFNSMLDRDKMSKIKGAEETSSFNPSQTGILQIPQQTIRQNIVTFNLKLITKPIEGVWVNLKFKGNPNEIKLGVRGSEKESFQYQPLYNQILNSLSWSQTSSGDTTFWQREKKYQDISELVSKPPISEDVTIASYFFNQSNITVKESKPTIQANSKIEKTLRGTHTLWVKVDKKPFLLTVVKQDANIYKGEDVLSIQVYNGQNKIAEQLIPDDGVVDNGGLRMTPQKGEIKINDIKPGIYRIVLKDKTANADILIKSVEVNQPSFVFQTPLFVGDEKPTTLWTNSKKINMLTYHATSIQTVKLDNKYDLKVEKEIQQFVFDLTNPESKTTTPSPGSAQALHKLEIPNNDLIITGDGYFTFSADSFFNPEPIKTVDLSTVTDISKIDYIVANYQPAKKEGEWYTAQAYFDPKDIKIDGDKLYFSLESPELNSYGGEIVIDSLEVTVKKPGWFSNPVAQKAGETVNAPQRKEVNANIFSRFFDWVARPFVAVWNWTKGVFVGKPKPTPTPTPSVRITPTSTSKPSPTATPSATPTTAASIELLIRVLNGGAEKGAAASVAALLKENGFTNVVADNADRSDYLGATIRYMPKDSEIVTRLEELLRKEYTTIIKIPIATTTAQTTIIVGKK